MGSVRKGITAKGQVCREYQKIVLKKGHKNYKISYITMFIMYLSISITTEF